MKFFDIKNYHFDKKLHSRKSTLKIYHICNTMNNYNYISFIFLEFS